jgi:hypothetical protein
VRHAADFAAKIGFDGNDETLVALRDNLRPESRRPNFASVLSSDFCSRAR